MWFGAWAEFEALNTLANYNYENPDHTFPEFASDGAFFKARELGHLLLPHASSVANDIELSRKYPFYLVSGSNMSGKTDAFAGDRIERSARVRRAPRCARASIVRAFDFCIARGQPL